MPSRTPLRLLKKLTGAVWKNNWSNYWGYFQTASGALLLVLSGIGQVINDPNVQTALNSLHLSPEISLGIAIFGAVTLLSLPKDK